MVSNPLRSVLDEPRPSAPPVRVWRDWALVAVVTVAGVLEATVREDLPLRWLSLLVTVGLAPLLLARRTHPFATVAIAFGVVAVVDIGLLVADAPALEMYTMIFFLVLPYSLFRWGSGREALAGLMVILIPATLGIVVSWTGLADAIGGTAVLMSAFALGLSVRTQHGAQERRLEQVPAATRSSPSITRKLLSSFAGTGRAARPVQPVDPLTEREEQVLLTVARGSTNAEIAAELHFSTVKTHIASLMAKLGARNRVEVAMWAHETGRVNDYAAVAPSGHRSAACRPGQLLGAQPRVGDLGVEVGRRGGVGGPGPARTCAAQTCPAQTCPEQRGQDPGDQTAQGPPDARDLRRLGRCRLVGGRLHRGRHRGTRHATEVVGLAGGVPDTQLVEQGHELGTGPRPVPHGGAVPDRPGLADDLRGDPRRALPLRVDVVDPPRAHVVDQPRDGDAGTVGMVASGPVHLSRARVSGGADQAGQGVVLRVGVVERRGRALAGDREQCTGRAARGCGPV